MWQIGRIYGFVPSGDADELAIRIVGKVLAREADEWFVRTYDRPVQGSGQAYKAVVVRGGFDADIQHSAGESYYVYSSDFSEDPAEVRLLQ